LQALGSAPSASRIRADALAREAGELRLGPHTIRFIKALVVTVLFVGLLCAPTLDWIFHVDRTAEANEKRLLAAFPSCNGFSQLRDFLAGLNLYFDDHFGFRRSLVHANNHWKRQLFRMPPTSDVLIGRDGWLYSGEGRMVNHYIGTERFSQADLEAWQQLLEKRRDWLGRRGCKFLFVIAPDKQSIYPEHLPAWLERGDKPGKMEQFFTHMGTHSTVHVVELRAPLLSAKSSSPVYLKTDTHWNKLGAFVAYEHLLRELSHEIPDLKPLPLAAFSYPQTPYRPGDLAEMLGDSAWSETQYLEFAPLSPLTAIEPVPAREILPKRSNKGTGPTMTTNDLATGKVVVFQDSFARHWRPLLAHHFKRVIYVPARAFEPELLGREKPDVVIQEMVERNFNVLDPRDLMIQDRLEGNQILSAN
jgi:hypothetical protein